MQVLDRQSVVCSDGGAPVDELTSEQICSFLHNPGTLGSIVAGAVILLLVAVLGESCGLDSDAGSHIVKL